jgi:hypothetical protein
VSSGNEPEVVQEDLLDNVKVTAERVERFATDVERDSSSENRKLWRAALADYSEAVRRARARGYESHEIQDQTSAEQR